MQLFIVRYMYDNVYIVSYTACQKTLWFCSGVSVLKSEGVSVSQVKPSSLEAERNSFSAQKIEFGHFRFFFRI